MINTRRIVTASGLLFGTAAGLLGAAYYGLVRRPLAKTRGRLRLAGLHAPVEVLRDRWGVPHIYAHSSHDVMFAQGFVHAQDRLWQMDFSRRLVAGRLSEVIGQAALPVDRWARLLGLRRVAEQEVQLIDPELRPDLEAYVAGINARIAQGRLPVEFSLLRYRPEAWTIADSLSWQKMLAWGLSVNWEAEIVRAQLIARLGPQKAAELEPDYFEGEPSAWPSIIPPGLDPALGQAALARAQAARRWAGPGAYEGLGSNNWAIAGSRTASGMPLLANDMHVLMSIPAIWYENHLCLDGPTPDGSLNLSGVTLPGVPGVVAGHNGYVAWGFTNAFPDVQDVYVEHVRRTDDGRVQYEYQGEWLDAHVIHEAIRVRGGKDVVEELILTRHGPIINALAPDLAQEQPLALRWTALEPDTAIRSLFGINRARTCLEFRAALRHWACPAQNAVYADTGGNIAYSLFGKIPIRAKGDGRLPVPGWTGEYEWTGYIPFEELPQLYNPPQGYIATANNRIAGDDYPYWIGYDHCTGDRARRIVELIESRDKIDLAYVQRMQFDQVLPTARVISQYISQLEVDEPELAAVVELMKSWDGHMAAGSPAAAVYEVFVRRLAYRVLSDKLGDLAVYYVGKSPANTFIKGSIFGERTTEWLRSILAEPGSHWFDLGRGEGRDEVVRLALRETLDDLKARLGPQASQWAWGKLHTLTYTHTLGSVKPLDRLFNRGPYPVGGTPHTIWAAGSSQHDLSCESIIGPPFRFIADLGNLRSAWGLLAPGQSGQPGSRHYDDQVQAWFTGEYHPMLYERQDVEGAARARLELLPDGQALG